MEILGAGRPSDFTPYHNGSSLTRSSANRQQRINRNAKKIRQIMQEDRPFIAWDGEGINILGPGKPQSYVLFGSSANAPIENILGLSTWDCLDHIVNTGEANPTAIHVGFAFGYDSNMIVQSLAPTTLMRLHKRGFVRLKRDPVTEYRLTYRKSKFLQVTRISNGDRVSVRIYDIFTFFMCSFEKAYTDMIGPVPTLLSEGKAGRKSFTVGEFEKVKRYWTLEIQMVRELAEELRRRVYAAGLYITEWHGPGALASFSMAQHGIKQHMKVCPDEVRLAARYAYAAGRFELFHVGRFEGPVWGVDLNSAYPAALRLVPSLSEGKWIYEDWTKRGSKKIHPFGLYYVTLKSPMAIGIKRLSPLFHRDKNHELTFPWNTEGWYWGPEAKQAVLAGATVRAAWQYMDWETRPFAYIENMFETRKRWKAEGNSAQMALKLCMNAKTGKAAQRMGYKENGRIPGWHQLEWAGFVTSYTRASLYMVMARIPFDSLISVETDGFYTTMDPASLGIVGSGELGGWSVDEYAEVMYVQSGLAWLRDTCDIWTPKRRGLDKESFELSQCVEYLGSLQAREQWPDFKGHTTRFTSMGMALAGNDAKAKHCVWVNAPREISVGRQGKRVHSPRFCEACKMGANAYEKAHDLIITPPVRHRDVVDFKSYPHSVPWEEEIGHAAYRDRWEDADDYVGQL